MTSRERTMLWQVWAVLQSGGHLELAREVMMMLDPLGPREPEAPESEAQ